MKKLSLTKLLATFASGAVILLTPQSSLAQVNMNILTEVVKSCQEDVFSPKYYEKMGIDISQWSSDTKKNFLEYCINGRYYHSLVMSKFPWLASTNEMLPEYPGSAAVSLISYNSIYELKVLECIVSQNSFSQECKNSDGFTNAFLGWKIQSNMRVQPRGEVSYTYICPSCVVANNNIISREEMTNAFIKWFLTLDKPKRRAIMSILGDERDQRATRDNMQNEAWEAVKDYNEIRQRVEQHEQEQRRENILGE